ncbi:hypothetical protein [Kytococcus sedentarius]|uniref:hypothetical protein n=1 Tax=Kytococcus sedentarius TaxID=1276 RepID=UPI001364AF69|nr:hypothetical protein [Kytococcus sedentarius]
MMYRSADNVLSCLFEAREGLLKAKAAADATGIDRDFDGLINQLDLLIYAIQGDL